MGTKITDCQQQTAPTRKWIPCNACGADSFQELSIADGWHIGRCRQCGLIYLNPMPFFVPSEEFSQMSLDFQYTRFQRNITAEVARHDAMQIRKQVAIVERVGNCGGGPKRFLDIGCGSGSSVRAAVDIGWMATGIDIDPVLVELGRRELQVDLQCGTLLESRLDGDQYHFIRLRDVIEHLPNPFEVLVEMKRLLVPGGIALIATPNEGALTTRLKLLMGLRRNTIATVAPPHHVHGFTPETMTLMIRRAGLHICALKTTTPVDKTYVTARNMGSARTLLVPLWQVADLVRKGSMLIVWLRKDNCSN
jgi:2-polyprenyl-3-methyl-5-hydroxy-6-metoxy-1,4-benzoquinol methylase